MSLLPDGIAPPTANATAAVAPDRIHRDSLPRVEAVLRAKYDGAGLGPARLLRSHAGPGASIEFS